eukprot:5685201-Amphidinium_carterae.1
MCHDYAGLIAFGAVWVLMLCSHHHLECNIAAAWCKTCYDHVVLRGSNPACEGPDVGAVLAGLLDQHSVTGRKTGYLRGHHALDRCRPFE